MVITGKGYGVTNLVVMDRAGTVLLDKSVEVQGPDADVVVLYRGIERETYSCTPICERRLTLGDGNVVFDTGAGPDRHPQWARLRRSTAHEVSCCRVGRIPRALCWLAKRYEEHRASGRLPQQFDNASLLLLNRHGCQGTPAVSVGHG